MDDARVALLLAAVEMQAAIARMGGALMAGSIVGTILLACMLFWSERKRGRLAGRLKRSIRREHARRVQFEQVAAAFAIARKKIAELEIENRRLVGIRVKAERGTLAKHQELEETRALVDISRRAPKLTDELRPAPGAALDVVLPLE